MRDFDCRIARLAVINSLRDSRGGGEQEAIFEESVKGPQGTREILRVIEWPLVESLENR